MTINIKYVILLFTILFILSCATEKLVVVRQTVVSMPIVKNTQLKQKISEGLGPFYLPLNHNLNSVSINYFSNTPEITKVFFSTAGKNEWVRKIMDKSIFHTMRFNQMEESSTYRFEISSEDVGIQKFSKVKTIPFLANYEFDFALINIDTQLQANFDSQPNFIVLLSKDCSINEDKFRDFFTNNKKILASSILIPAFDFTVLDKNFSISKGGFYAFKYKDLYLVVVNNNIKNYSSIANHLSSTPEDINYIIFSNVDENKAALIYKMYGNSVNKFLSYKQYDSISTEIVSNFKVETIQKKGKRQYVYEHKQFIGGDGW